MRRTHLAWSFPPQFGGLLTGRVMPSTARRDTFPFRSREQVPRVIQGVDLRASAPPPSPKASNERGVYMKRFSLVAISFIVLAAITALAAPNPSAVKVPAFPGILANARYVYVASYDGDQFDSNLLPEDRDAIGDVQNAIQKWGKLTIVYQPSEADIIILVTSRPSEDLLAVYDAHQGPTSNFLWRVMGQGGLQSGETPLVTQFTKGFESVQKHK